MVQALLLSLAGAQLPPSYRRLLWLGLGVEEVLLILHFPLVFCSRLLHKLELTWLKCPFSKSPKRREFKVGISRIEPE